MHKTKTVHIGAAEAARILGVDVRTVHRRVERGEVPFIAKLDGYRGPYIFDRAAVEALVEERAAI